MHQGLLKKVVLPLMSSAAFGLVVYTSIHHLPGVRAADQAAVPGEQTSRPSEAAAPRLPAASDTSGRTEGRAAYATDPLFAKVIEKAEKAADSAYKAPAEIPAFMQDLAYQDYQNIRFNPDKSLWKDRNLPFQMMFIPPGLFYQHSVKINIVENGQQKPLSFQREWFSFSDPELEKKVPHDLGYAGFKLTHPINRSDIQDQFMVFAGASYFRAVAAGNAWGISARGIAVNTGLPRGEEFPSFTEYWMEPPAADAKSMTVYALLDGPSISGAYKFVITPGERTVIKVQNVLFPRKDIELLGVAPLTSMYFYGENMTRPTGEWRPEVHDSDGLLIQDRLSGEWLWRPLLNPQTLEMDYFKTDNIGAFGLIQRADDFDEFRDMEAHYEKRPSMMVRPVEGWGKGSIVLTQLPTDNETNDNIVAFWKPGQPVKAGSEFSFAYDVIVGSNDIEDIDTGKARHTFVGDGNRIGGGDTKGAYRFIVDFEGGALSELGSDAKVLSQVSAFNGAELIEHYVQYNPTTKQWRLSILAKPAANQSLNLRAYLKREDDNAALTETWTYRLPWNNTILDNK
tara:strand:- start:39065 stop:40768 length:1704 start_codon:yes stop_codon:yes gene_type:complete